MAENKIILSLDDQQFIQRLRASLGISKSFDDSVKSWKKTLSDVDKAAPGKSIGELNNRLANAKKQLDFAAVGTKDFENALRRVQVLSGHVNRAQELHNKTLKQAGLQAFAFRGNFSAATNTLMSMNQIVQDLPYGFRGIANNIQMASQQAIYLVQSSGGVISAFKAIGSALMGPVGVMFAISAVTSALDYYSMSASRSSTETKNLAQESQELNERIRTLAAGYDELAEGNASYRKELYATAVAEQEALIASMQNKLSRGGVVIKGDFIPYTGEQVQEYKNIITQAQEKIKSLLSQSNKFVAQNVDLLKGLAKASLEGASGIERFARANKLSQGQLENLSKQLSDYQKNITAVGGGLAKELTPGQREIAIRLGMQNKEVGKAVKSLDDYFDSLKNKGKQTQSFLEKTIQTDEEIQKQLKEIQVLLDAGNLSERHRILLLSEQIRLRRELNYETIKNTPNARGADINLASTKKGLGQFRMTTVNEPGKPSIQEAVKLSGAEMDEVQFKVDLLSASFQSLGDSIVDAMFGAKISIGEVITEIGKLAAKIAVTAGIKMGLSFLFPSLAAFFSEGGLSSSPARFGVVSPDSFIGAKQFATGGFSSVTASGGGIPAILHPDEMILNKRQQTNLFNAINSNRIAQNLSQTVNVKLSGEMGFRGKDFIVKFQQLQDQVNTILSGASFDRG
jgi:prefoldin subunit 5